MLEQNEKTFAEELERVVSEADTSIRRLARLTGISRRTLENWLYGHVLRPRQVEPVLQIAHALHLPAEETDRLLLSADYPPLTELKQEGSGLPAELLSDWQLAPDILLGQKSAALTSRHNLPASTTPFLGRQVMCEELTGLIRRPDIRLITVNGLGGAGKTRLALEVARSNEPRFDHGVYFIPLDNIGSADTFWEAILDGLHIPNDGTNLPRRLVLDYLHDKQVLLLLDNFEHLLPITAEITHLLGGTQRLKLLLTSRQALDLQAEQLYPIGGLSYAEGTDSPAYQLYVQTAQRRIPGYEPSAEEAQHIEALTAAVDGLPLALDLAATWRDVLNPKQVLAHMQGNLQLVRHQASDRPARHHNIWELFAFSWQILDEAERHAALRLSVMRGSFSLEMASAIAECMPGVLKRLIQSSFIGQIPSSRLVLHPLVRQFLSEKAISYGWKIEKLEDRFVNVVMGWVSEQSSQLRETFKASYYQELHAEWQHIERAWWLAVDRQQYDLLLSCWDLLFYFEARGTYRKGYAFFEATRQQIPAENRRMQARLDEAQAFFAARLLEVPRAMKLARRSLQTLDALGDDSQNGEAAGKYAQVILVTADHAIKQTAFSNDDKDALRKVTDGYLNKFTDIALALHDGVVDCNFEDFTSAVQAFDRALKIGGEDGYVMPILRCFLGIALKKQGQIDVARDQFSIALQRALELELYPAVIGATYELRLLQGDNPTTGQCRDALEHLALEMGSRRTVGQVAALSAVQYLNLGFTGQAQQLTRIGVGMLWHEVDTAERARILATIAHTYLAYGLIRKAPQIASLVAPQGAHS